MPDAALKQYAEMHKEDPYTFSLALSESNRRKQMRSQVPQAAPQPKVVEQELADMDVRKALPEDLGIARLPVDMNMAGGGIVAFGDGGKTDYGNEGRTPVDTYRAYALAKATEKGVDPVLVDSIFKIESNYNPKAQSRTGPQGIGQLTKATGKAYGVNPEDRKDPYKNIDASIAFMADLNKKYNGDASKIAVAYNQGEGVLNNHLRANKGVLNPSTLPEEAQGYLKKLQKFAFNAMPGSEANAGELRDRVSDKTLSDLVTGESKPQKSATFSGVGEALKTKEGLKRAGIGALEDSTLGLAGMPNELGRGMADSRIPIIGAMGQATKYLAKQFAPNASPDVGTTEYLKRKATEAGIRPEDSTDPNLRAIQSGGEFAGYFAHPIDLVRSGAGKVANAFRGARAEMQASGLGEIAQKKAAAAAEAQARADAAAQKANTPRLEGPAPTAPAKPAATGVAPPLTPQGAAFPLSEESLRLKNRAEAAAAERAAQRAPAQTTAGVNLALDKAEAAKRASMALERKMEADTARAVADAKAAEAANAASKPVPRAVPGKSVAAMNQDLPDITTGSGAVDDRTPRDPKNYDVIQPAAPKNPDDRTPRDPANYTPEKIAEAAKIATPPTADNEGWSGNDWLQFGLAMMAGQSPNAMQNIGNAGLNVLANKTAREQEKNKLDMYKTIHAEKPGQSIQIAERLMAANPKLSFEAALAKATELTGGSTKQDVADSRSEAVLATRIKNYQAAVKEINGSLVGMRAAGAKATPEAKKAYQDAIAALGPNPALEGVQQPAQTTAPAAVIPGAKIVGTR